MNDPSKNIPTNVSTPEQWISWHQSLKGWFSKKDANDYWVKFGINVREQELRLTLLKLEPICVNKGLN